MIFRDFTLKFLDNLLKSVDSVIRSASRHKYLRLWKFITTSWTMIEGTSKPIVTVSAFLAFLSSVSRWFVSTNSKNFSEISFSWNFKSNLIISRGFLVENKSSMLERHITFSEFCLFKNLTNFRWSSMHNPCSLRLYNCLQSRWSNIQPSPITTRFLRCFMGTGRAWILLDSSLNEHHRTTSFSKFGKQRQRRMNSYLVKRQSLMVRRITLFPIALNCFSKFLSNV